MDLLEKPVLAALATLMLDFQPQVNSVWCLYSDGCLKFFTTLGSQKEKNLRLRSQATILLMDPFNPFRYMEIRGVVEELVDENAEALADRLTQKYLGEPAYFGTVAPLDLKDSIELVAFNLRPTRVVTVG